MFTLPLPLLKLKHDMGVHLLYYGACSDDRTCQGASVQMIAFGKRTDLNPLPTLSSRIRVTYR